MDYSEILVGLRKIIRQINLESKKIQKEFGISIPQLLSLTYLDSFPEKKTNAKQIAGYLNLNASTMSGIIARLEKKGLISRVHNSEDKRKRDVSLTEAGMVLLTQAPTTIQQKVLKKLAALPKEEISRLTGTVDFLAELFEADDLDASPVITIEEISDSGM